MKRDEKKKTGQLVTGCEKNTFHIPHATFFKRLVHTTAFILLRRKYLAVIRRYNRVAFSNLQSPKNDSVRYKESAQDYVRSVQKTLGN